MGLATLPFPGSDFRIEHETNPVIEEPSPDGLAPGLDVSRGDVLAEAQPPGLRIEHTLVQQADAIVVNWDDMEKVDADALPPGTGASRGELRCEDQHSCAIEDEST
ncbi:MAG: hypothetical protein AAF479_14005, partial [Pseudomonadota bacterium]